MIVDLAKVKCNETKAMESIKLGNQCVADNHPELKKLMDKKEAPEVCHKSTKELFKKIIEDGSFQVILDCMEKRKDLEKYDPFVYCTGIV